MKKVLYILNIIIFSCSTNFFGQIEPSAKVEIHTQDYDGFEAHDFGLNGIIITYYLKTGKNELQYFIEKYDKNLSFLSKKSLQINFIDKRPNYLYSEDKLYLLFQDFGNYLLYEVSVDDLSVKTPIELSGKPSIIVAGAIFENNIIFGVINKKSNSIVGFNIKTNVSFELPLSIENVSDSDIQIEGLEISNENLLLYFNTESKEGNDLYVSIFDKDIIQKNSFCLTETTDKVISNIGLVSSSDNSDFLFMGTYSNSYQQNLSGIFMARASNGKLIYFHEKKFLELNEEQMEQLDPKIAKKLAKMQNSGRLDKIEPYVASPSLFHSSTNFYILTEMCQPDYGLYYNATKDGNESVIKSFRYTGTLLACFKDNGGFMWKTGLPLDIQYVPRNISNYMEYERSHKYRPEHFKRYSFYRYNNENIDIMYLKDNFVYINTISLEDGGFIKENKLLFNKDNAQKIVWDQNKNNVIPFEKNTYFISGYIRENSEKESFFIYKISL